MSERSVGSAVAFGGEAELRGGYLIRKEEIELSKKLGEGAFGAVFRGKCRGANVAVKVPSKDIEEDQLLEFKMEVNTMASISHPRLAMLLGENRSRIFCFCLFVVLNPVLLAAGAFIPPPGSKDSVMIVLELLSGDMETILHRDQKAKKLSLFQRMEWAMQAAEGMAWLHGAGMIHRDMV